MAQRELNISSGAVLCLAQKGREILNFFKRNSV